MRVAVTFNLSESDRRAISCAVGHDRPATYDQVKTWIVGTVEADLDSIASELPENKDGDA